MSRCNKCKDGGFDEMECSFRFTTEELVRAVTPWHGITGIFEDVRNRGADKCEIDATIKIDSFPIAWERRKNLMDDIEAVIKKYAL